MIRLGLMASGKFNDSQLKRLPVQTNKPLCEGFSWASATVSKLSEFSAIIGKIDEIFAKIIQFEIVE
jgi:hypothetical protein